MKEEESEESVRSVMAELAKKIYNCINELLINEFHGEKIMDLPEYHYDIGIFELALKEAKQKGADTFNTSNVGEKGFFKNTPIIDIVERDLTKLQELLTQFKNENPV